MGNVSKQFFLINWTRQERGRVRAKVVRYWHHSRLQRERNIAKKKLKKKKGFATFKLFCNIIFLALSKLNSNFNGKTRKTNWVLSFIGLSQVPSACEPKHFPCFSDMKIVGFNNSEKEETKKFPHQSVVTSRNSNSMIWHWGFISTDLLCCVFFKHSKLVWRSRATLQCTKLHSAWMCSSESDAKAWSF